MSALIEQYKEMHASSEEMFAGFSLMPHALRIKKLIEAHNIIRILDYGCGKGKQYLAAVKDETQTFDTLEQFWGVAVAKYDPGYAPFSIMPDGPFDAVICTDVLEHLEPGQEAEIVQELFNLADKFVFASISCKPAVKTLPDGRNAHTCIKKPEEWAELFQAASNGKPWKIVCDHEFGQWIKTNATVSAATQKLVIETRNCVPNEQIISQVKYAQSLNLPWVNWCYTHARKAVFVSAGPSWFDYLSQIREHYQNGDPIFCVKHAHDTLIAEGIIPFGCFLLDPRGHVKDFIENPHPDTRYFVASMCHPTTLERLHRRGAKVFLYHALVGAGEDKVIKQGICFGGGSCSATRGLYILKAMGFLNYALYGYDSCFFEPPEAVETLTLNVAGKDFTTTAELAAQVQDFEKFIREMPDLNVETYGRGIVPHVHSVLRDQFRAKGRPEPLSFEAAYT